MTFHTQRRELLEGNWNFHISTQLGVWCWATWKSPEMFSAREWTTKSLLAKTILTAKLSRLPALRRFFSFWEKIYLCIWFWHLKMGLERKEREQSRVAGGIIKVGCQSAAKFTLWTRPKRGGTSFPVPLGGGRDAGRLNFWFNLFLLKY